MAGSLNGTLRDLRSSLQETLEIYSDIPAPLTRFIRAAETQITLALGETPSNQHIPEFVSKFDVGDRVTIIMQSYAGPDGKGITPAFINGVSGRPATIRHKPIQRSPNDIERDGEKTWFFTSQLPAYTSKQVECFMYVETETEIREVFHLRNEHWSTWHEKNGPYWSILTIFPDETGDTFSVAEGVQHADGSQEV